MGKSGPLCQVCASKDRHTVELGLVARVPSRVLAQRFGLSRDAILRHSRNHLPAQVRASLLTALRPSDIDLDALRESEGRSLLASLIAQRARLALLSEACFAEGELHAATSVEARITASLELTSRLLGQLVTHHHTTSTSVLISADYLQLRQVLIAALKPFPEAARAVAAALGKLEVTVAEDIAKRDKPLLLEAPPC